MDDHFEALSLWKDVGLRNFTCVHVDAHLDVQDAGLSMAMVEQIAQGASLADFRGNPRLPWGGLHCGNYLYPALRAGWIEHLVWVFPPHLVRGPSLLDWLRAELLQWVDLSLEEYSALRTSAPGRVEGQLAGQRFTACTADAMPVLSGAVALDIDIDYFVTLDDELWQSPQVLQDLLGELSPTALTVATSIEGGYTPDHRAGLGPECLQRFGGQPQEWTAPVSQAVDHASRCMHRKDYQQGLQCLLPAQAEDPVRLYLEATLQLKLKNLPGALQALERLARADLTSAERAQIGYMAAGIELLRQRPRPAQKHIELALSLVPPRGDFFFRSALTLKKQGQYRQAARQLRHALTHSEGKVSSLEVQLELARTYAEMGQQGLAQATHRQLQAMDVTGLYAIESLLEEAR